MDKYVIVVAGGKGQRMGAAVPKQFLEIEGKAIIIHTLEKFSKALPQAELLLVLPESEFPRWENIAKGTPFEKLKLAKGGESRFHSVKSGLSLIEGKGIVGIHDSVRPFVSEKTIQTSFETAEQYGAAIPVVELKDSLRKIEGQNSKAVDRKAYKIVQTPQCFKLELIQEAYKQHFSESFTDDATVLEASGQTIHLVEGDYDNIKITTIDDLRRAKAIMNN